MSVTNNGIMKTVDIPEDGNIGNSEISNTKYLKRSNSLSALNSSIKIMEEANNYLTRTKEQLSKPEIDLA